MKIRSLVLIGSFVALGSGVGGGWLQSASAQENAPAQGARPDRTPVQTTKEAIAAEAEWYARDQGVSMREAVRRVRIQREMGTLIDELRRVHKNRLAGVVIDHKPTYRLRIRLTGSEPLAAQAFSLAGSTLPVVFETGAKATLRSLRGSLRRHQAALGELYPTLAGVGIDESTGQIVLTVYAPPDDEAEAAFVQSKLSEAQALLGQSARVEVVHAYPTMQDVRGGSRLVSSTNFLCTSAFVVKNTSGTTGVTTAGHCDNSETYYNPNGTSIPLTLVAGSEYLDADQDVQVHTSAYAEQPEFYWDDNKTTARILTGRRLKSSTAFNDNVCHRGETTGYSCGYVQQTDYAPYNPSQPLCGSQTCATVFVRVTGSSLECSGGDSGGPWFASTVAFGIHKGGSSTGTGPGQCAYAFYMSTDTISSGWSLLYGQ